MINLHHKFRWVFSPIDAVTGQPVAKEYAMRCEAPFHHDGHALAYCEMNAHQLEAARKDPRLIVLPSIHEPVCIHPRVLEHHAGHGAKPFMQLHELLGVMAKHHPGFEPEH